jgi:putative ABC transport system ATP-binding protein
MPLINLVNVTKKYIVGDSVVNALKNVSISIEKGEYVAIMGPSGSGKSTLLNIIGLLDKPTEGKYFLEEKDVSLFQDNVASQIRNKKIGFIFQTFNLFPQLSVIENIEVPLEYSKEYKKNVKEKILELISRLGLSHRIRHKPTQLSGGEMQRVAIARALVNDPLIILADEPTGNIDEKSGDEIIDIFTQLNKEGKTIILVTHNPRYKKVVKRVITLHDGKVEEDSEN